MNSMLAVIVWDGSHFPRPLLRVLISHNVTTQELSVTSSQHSMLFPMLQIGDVVVRIRTTTRPALGHGSPDLQTRVSARYCVTASASQLFCLALPFD